MGWRVILAEDEPGIRVLLAEVLEDAGYDVLQACDGDEAVALLANGGIDLLITDIDMPGRDGFAVSGEARSRNPGLPVLFVSGRHDGVAGRTGTDACRFLRKPFNLNALLDEVRGLLPGAPASGPGPAEPGTLSYSAASPSA